MKENLLQFQVALPVDYTEDDLRKVCIKKLKLKPDDLISYEIKKKSIDARKKEEVCYNLSLILSIREKVYKKLLDRGLKQYINSSYTINKIASNKSIRPIIVGSGPAGLFSAYTMVLSGLNPIIIERGRRVEERSILVDRFFSTGELSEDTNVQFGEGGAGTFSDGKLNTMVKDPFLRIPFVLDTFVKFGANPEIKYMNKPHIGTDVLKKVLINMRKEIIKLGGEYRFETKLTDIRIKDKRVYEIVLNDKEVISCNQLVLALGHSARDTFRMLLKRGIEIVEKPFAVGLRIEHPQEWINVNQYGKFSDRLPPAEYKLTHKLKNGRGVYSFCMCPGGYVVNASSKKGATLVNGMSYNNRGSRNANSAIVVTVDRNDFKKDEPLAGVLYQEELEEKAFSLAGGKIPIQLFGDFVENRISNGFGEIEPVTKGAVEFSNLRGILPDYLSESIIEGVRVFSKKIKNFDRADVILSGIETRTSSPIRILRNENFESNIAGIYPIGEGAGYAGGITSAAVDGIKLTEKIIGEI